MEDESLVSRKRREFKQLKNEAAADGWLSHWREIAEYMLPRKGRYLTNDSEKTNTGHRKDQKIINGVAKQAINTLSSGMQEGLTPPSRPWFVLGFENQELLEIQAVKDWLYDVRSRMLFLFAKSNFYPSMRSLYKEVGTFGTAVVFAEEDFETGVRFRPFTIGEFVLAQDWKNHNTTLFRQFSQTAGQMVEQYGIEAVSESVKSSYKNNQKHNRFEVVHCVFPNEDKDDSKKDFRGMDYGSLYFELNGNSEDVLRKAGYKELPFFSPRWEVTGVDVYGESPGMDNLGDCKMLQKMEEKKLKALDKMVDPPMNAPSSMKSTGGTLVPGGINYVNIVQGQQPFKPAYEIRPDIQNIEFGIEKTEKRIERGFFTELFTPISQMDKSMSATEVVRRNAESLKRLGNVVGKIHEEALNPIITRTFSIMSDQNLLPEAPREIQGLELQIEYISPLAQAQKAGGNTAIADTIGFVANIAAVKPEVIDKINFDEVVDQYADLAGISPEIVRSDDDVRRLREARAAEQARMAQQAQLQAAVDSAKTMSETDMSGENALTNVTQGLIGQ